MCQDLPERWRGRLFATPSAPRGCRPRLESGLIGSHEGWVVGGVCDAIKRTENVRCLHAASYAVKDDLSFPGSAAGGMATLDSSCSS